MKLSENGIQFLISLEGFKRTPYKDVIGIDTIGVGHVIKSSERFINALSDEEVLKLLKKDIEEIGFERNLSNLNLDINQRQFDACFSLSFNVGITAFNESTLLSILKGISNGQRDNNYLIASNEFLKWNKANGKVIQGLVNRRMKERRLFLYGIYEG